MDHPSRTPILLLFLLHCLVTASAAATNSIPLIQININSKAVNSLEQAPRKNVPVTIHIEGQEITAAEAHLKGHGSFRPISGKPSFSIRSSEKNLFGRKKLLLNNSSQDSSFLKWKIASELFLKAGVPAPQVSFAKVRLNNRDLGLYVMVEPTDKDFLKKHFGSANGNLYEGSNHDVNEPLELDNGNPETAQKDLKPLVQACRQRDLAKRWTSLGKVLDLDRFISFMAAEVLVGHRDGYSLDRNNFRIYHDPQSNKFVFIPHGMDLLFTDAPLKAQFSGLVATAVFETPQGKAAYKARTHVLAREFFGSQDLLHRMSELSETIHPHVDTKEKAAIQELIRTITSRTKDPLPPEDP